jgi:hypothetical protein
VGADARRILGRLPGRPRRRYTHGVSQHLAKLRLAGLVRHRREGMYVYYEAADKGLERILAEALGESAPKAPSPAKGRRL